jgi:transcriptional regulator with XRE-family HTH domain
MPENEPNQFRKWRDAAGLTQFAAAIAMGVTTGAVSGWELGQTPSLKLADKIAEVYGVPVAKVLEAMREMAVTAATAR